MTGDRSAHVRASQVTDQSCCVSLHGIGKVKQGKYHQKTMQGPVKKGKYSSGVHRSHVHSICKAGPMVQLVMGPMRASGASKQSWRLMGVMQNVVQVHHMAVYL